MSQILHLDVDGKTARVTLQTLPKSQSKLDIVQQTSAGKIERIKISSGLKPVKDPTFELITAGDPEIELENAGTILDSRMLTTAFYKSGEDAAPVSGFSRTDIILNPDETEKERRPHLTRKNNTNDLHPVKTRKRIKIEDALTGFVFKQVFQIAHEDGVQKDFLHSLAKDLQEKGEVAILGAGPKGNMPLVTREGGSPYHSFLYGEVDGQKYKLLLLLSDQALKVPPTTLTPAAGPSEAAQQSPAQ